MQVWTISSVLTSGYLSTRCIHIHILMDLQKVVVPRLTARDYR